VFGDCLSHISSEQGLLLSLLIGGLIGSITHCTAMCGPMVLAQIGALDRQPAASAFAAVPAASSSTGMARYLWPYHMGRITTYVLLAVIFGVLTGLASVFGFPKALLSIVLLTLAGVMFLVSALPGLAQIFPWVARISLPVPQGLVARLSKPLTINPRGLRGYLLGIILGFMPCGLVIAALMAASTASHPLMAGFAMISFGIGTMPALVMTGLGAHWLKRNAPVSTQTISALVMAANSLLLFWLAAQQVI